MSIDFVVVPPNLEGDRRHYIDHLAPVYLALPDEHRGNFYCTEQYGDYARSKGIKPVTQPTRLALKKALLEIRDRPLTVVCGHADPGWLYATKRPNAIMMHGVGFCFDKDRKHPSYPGTRMHREHTRLILATNEHIAEIERQANPHIRVEAVGCPKLDRWHAQDKKPRSDKPVIALAWHWDCHVSRDTRTAFYEYRHILPELKERYHLLGHGHPSIIDKLIPEYESMGIEWTASIDEVFERADLMTADATSAIFEFASLDRPVVALMSGHYREPDFGGMLTYRRKLGVVCESPEQLVMSIELALNEPQDITDQRRATIAECYAYTDGECSRRAAEILMEVSVHPFEPEKPNNGGNMRDMGRRRERINRYREKLGITPYKEKIFGRKEGQSTNKQAVDLSRESWMERMGWKIPKSKIRLADPDAWPDVAIIIPVYNAPNLLERCLESLKLTDYPETIKTVVVDNASNDPETLKILAGCDNTIRFAEPVGFSEAVNAGMRREKRAEYYVLFNQDVKVIDKDWLKHLIRWMEHKPECAVSGPKLLYDNGKIENAGIDMGVGDGCAERGRGFPKNEPRFNDYRKTATVSGAAYCLRASVAKQMGYFDERYLFGCEDLEFGMRVSAKHGLECWYVPDSVLIHSGHAVQKSVSKEDRKRVRAMHRVSSEIYNREWGRFIDHVGGTRVAFVLPNFHSACGGARVVGALARQLSICGVQAEVFAKKIDSDPDTDFPTFSVRPFDELKETDIIIATRCDTVFDCKNIPAKKRYYFVQQIEDCMSKNFGVSTRRALASYQEKDFEIITIGQHLADRLKAMGRDSHIVDVGLYRHLYPYVKRKMNKKLRVLMYGADGYKGPDQPQIAKAIRQLIPGAVVNCYHRYSAECKWADTHFRPQTTAEVAELYAQHDVYVYASESDGFAMTPVEAMACGTPVVLSDFPGKDQYARNGENCLIAPFRDVAGIAEAVKQIADDNKLWGSLVKEGLKTADKYDWSVVGAQYARILLEAPV